MLPMGTRKWEKVTLDLVFLRWQQQDLCENRLTAVLWPLNMKNPVAIWRPFIAYPYQMAISSKHRQKYNYQCYRLAKITPGKAARACTRRWKITKIAVTLSNMHGFWQFFFCFASFCIIHMKKNDTTSKKRSVEFFDILPGWKPCPVYNAHKQPRAFF